MEIVLWQIFYCLKLSLCAKHSSSALRIFRHFYERNALCPSTFSPKRRTYVVRKWRKESERVELCDREKIVKNILKEKKYVKETLRTEKGKDIRKE